MNTRTLSGADEGDFTILNLKSIKDAIRIEGNSGTRGQVLQKSSTNKLTWGFIDDIEIPDHSITGQKLALDITFSTTGLIRADEFFSNYFIVPQTGAQQVIIDADGITLVGNLEIDAPNSLLRINNISVLGGGGVSPTLDIVLGDLRIQDGNINLYGDLELYDASSVKRIELLPDVSDLRLFTSAGIKTIDIDGNTGDLKLYSYTTGNNLLELDGQSGNILMRYGGRLDMYAPNNTDINIELNGANGVIDCKDINVSGHTGSISFNQIRTDLLTITKADNIVIINSDGIAISGAEKDLSCGGCLATFSNLVVNGAHGVLTGLISGDVMITSSTGDTPQDGDLRITNGDLNIDTGNITLTAGDITIGGNSVLKGGVDIIGDNTIDIINSSSNLTTRIYPATGNITNANGQLTMSKIGSTPAPTDNTYTDWAIDITSNNGHQHIGGNLIVDGTIYANVEGSITEEEVDCQRLTIRTATPPISGITGLIMGTGSKITNDIVGTNQLTITADTGDILCNTFQSKGNTAFGSDPNSIITFGSYGANLQHVEMLCSTINIGETAGNQAQNVLNYRGGVHTFTGQKVVIGDYIGFTLIDCALEGINNRVSNRYTNAFNYFNMNGALNTHTLSGTIQQYRILRSASQRQQLIAHTKPFTNSSTIYTTISGFSFVNIFCVTTVAKITIEYLFRKTSGNPDLYCRIDDTLTGASAYPSQIGGPTLLVNTNFSGEIRKQYSFFITGLPQGFQKSFYPKFADTTTSTNKGYLMYGGSFGDTTMTIEFLQDFDGTITDPLAPSGDDY